LGPKVSLPPYVASAVNAGGMGFIVGAGFSPAELREQVSRCLELTDGKPCGINFYISRQEGTVDRIKAQIEAVADSGISCVETAGSSPEPFVPMLKQAGIKILHKVPAVRYALSVAKLPIDGIIIVGNDCGGHPGVYGIGSMVQAAHATSAIKLPIVIGGGIGAGSQLAAVLAMGGEGVIMGTRAMVAEELWVHRKWKERIVSADGTESVIIKKALRDHHRVYRNESAEAVLELDDARVTDFEQYRPHVMGAQSHAAYVTGDYTRGTLDFGPSAVFADRVEPMEAIFDRMIDDAVVATDRLQSVRSPAGESVDAAAS
jgi:nitronate monooxygenase